MGPDGFPRSDCPWLKHSLEWRDIIRASKTDEDIAEIVSLIKSQEINQDDERMLGYALADELLLASETLEIQHALSIMKAIVESDLTNIQRHLTKECLMCLKDLENEEIFSKSAAYIIMRLPVESKACSSQNKVQLSDCVASQESESSVAEKPQSYQPLPREDLFDAKPQEDDLTRQIDLLGVEESVEGVGQAFSKGGELLDLICFEDEVGKLPDQLFDSMLVAEQQPTLLSGQGSHAVLPRTPLELPCSDAPPTTLRVNVQRPIRQCSDDPLADIFQSQAC